MLFRKKKHKNLKYQIGDIVYKSGFRIDGNTGKYEFTIFKMKINRINIDRHGNVEYFTNINSHLSDNPYNLAYYDFDKKEDIKKAFDKFMKEGKKDE